MIIQLGDTLKNRLTGEFFEVKLFRMNKVLLVSKEFPDKSWYGDDVLMKFLFEKVREGNNGISLFNTNGFVRRV